MAHRGLHGPDPISRHPLAKEPHFGCLLGPPAMGSGAMGSGVMGGLQSLTMSPDLHIKACVTDQVATAEEQPLRLSSASTPPSRRLLVMGPLQRPCSCRCLASTLSICAIKQVHKGDCSSGCQDSNSPSGCIQGSAFLGGEGESQGCGR